MGQLGFLFENYLGGEIVVFVSRENFDYDLVIGICEKAQLSNIEDGRILNVDLSLKKYPIFNNAKFRYGKICVSKTTFVDYENLTIWFNINKYKKLRQLFEEDINSEDELIKRVVEIWEYFK